MAEWLNYLESIAFHDLFGDIAFTPSQLGSHIQQVQNNLYSLPTADVIIIGVTDNRGNLFEPPVTNAANVIRQQLYNLTYWHTDVNIVDAGNIISGKTLADTYAALQFVLSSLQSDSNKILILGGSNDMVLSQYYAFSSITPQIELTAMDAYINLRSDIPEPSKTYLQQLFMGEPNFLKHYNHLAFQSYFVDPSLLEMMDKLRFDFYRLGTVIEMLDDMEPNFRDSQIGCLDVCALKYADAPANRQTPNGLSGIETARLLQFAGMSSKLQSFGVYEFKEFDDVHNITAKQLAQLCWYYIDGVQKGKQEASFADKHLFNEYSSTFSNIQTLFLQSKKTNRWWMQMPDGNFIACTKNDYLHAVNNNYPERWLRYMERL